MVTNAIEKAQRKVEGRNFDIRKNLLEYDDVANDQRKVVYAQRDSLLDTDNVSETIADLRAEVVNTIINQFVPPESLQEQWDVKGLERSLVADTERRDAEWLEKEDDLNEDGLRERILAKVVSSYNAKQVLAGEQSLRAFEKHILLRVLDDKWKEHLSTMGHLRQGIHLRGYAAKNPKQECKREAFELFSQMLVYGRFVGIFRW